MKLECYIKLKIWSLVVTILRQHWSTLEEELYIYIYIYEITQTQKIKCMDFFFIKYLFIAQQILS